MKEPKFTTWTFKSEGYEEAYIRYLEKRLRLAHIFGTGAMIGWFITAVILMELT